MHAPLLVTRDNGLLDDLLRLSAAAGVTLDLAHDPAAALRQWTSASLVLVGPDLAGSVAAQAPPRRTDVFLLAQGEADYRAAVALGATDVVGLPAGEAWLVEALSDAGDGGPRSAVTIGFVGGSGGVGATTLACATAALSARHRPTALLDLDPLGAGVERVVGLEQSGLCWSDLVGSQGRLGSRALRDSMPERDGLAVLGWGADSVPSTDDVAVREVLAAARRGNDLVVVDLPRHLTSASMLVASRCDHVVLVGACSVAGATAAIRAITCLAAATASVQLAARAGSGAVTAAALAAALELPLVATVGEQRRLSEQVDLGLGPLHSRRGPVARAAAAIVARFAA